MKLPLVLLCSKSYHCLSSLIIFSTMHLHGKYIPHYLVLKYKFLAMENFGKMLLNCQQFRTWHHYTSTEWRIKPRFLSVHLSSSISGKEFVKIFCHQKLMLYSILLPYDTNFGGRKFWQNSSRQSLTDNILANAQNCHKVPKIIMRWLSLVEWNRRVLPWCMVRLKCFAVHKYVIT